MGNTCEHGFTKIEIISWRVMVHTAWLGKKQNIADLITHKQSFISNLPVQRILM